MLARTVRLESSYWLQCLMHFNSKYRQRVQQLLTFAVNCGSNVQILLIICVVLHAKPFPSSRSRCLRPERLRFSIKLNANFTQSQFLVCFQINIAVNNLPRIKASISVNFNRKQLDCFHNADAGYIPICGVFGESSSQVRVVYAWVNTLKLLSSVAGGSTPISSKTLW